MTRELLPLPLTPVNAVMAWWGMRTSTPRRLWVRTPNSSIHAEVSPSGVRMSVM